MKAALLLISLLMAGCQSAPRPFDGHIGYGVTHRDDGLVVTYIEERRVSTKRHLLKVERVCRDRLPGSEVVILSREDTEVEVPGSVPVLIGYQNTGTVAGSMSGDSVLLPVYHNERLLMSLRTRTVVALCRPAQPG